jgi:hypothetical protein
MLNLSLVYDQKKDINRQGLEPELWLMMWSSKSSVYSIDVPTKREYQISTGTKKSQMLSPCATIKHTKEKKILQADHAHKCIIVV